MQTTEAMEAKLEESTKEWLLQSENLKKIEEALETAKFRAARAKGMVETLQWVLEQGVFAPDEEDSGAGEEDS